MSAQLITLDLICCGWDEVYVIPSEAGDGGFAKKWTWTSSDSPSIPEEARAWFATTDDCKPYGDRILISSSSGGVALVRRSDKQAEFLAFARNAHSACLLPAGRIAVASSTGGDELLVFDGDSSGMEAQPVARLPLQSAHGAEWDAGRDRLWALGTDELLLVRLLENETGLELEVDKRWDLPNRGGHDLVLSADGRQLLLTNTRHVYRFDIEDERFIAHQALGELADVKSVNRHPESGVLVYMQAGENWWNDTIRFAGEDRVIRLEGERIYKVRWDLPRPIPR